MMNRVGAGFRNGNNACYLNSVVQSLIHTVPLVQKLQTHHHTCTKTGDHFCSLCVLRSVASTAMSNSGKIVRPLSLTNNLNKISKDFRSGQQEDAHEFLHCLLDSVHNASLDSPAAAAAAMDETSLVKEVYGGRLISQLRCSECGHCSNTSEPLLDLSLDIMAAAEDENEDEDAVDSLVTALGWFTRSESIEETKFGCEGCKAKVTMEKQTKVEQAPQVLSLHLKRFKNKGISVEKMNKSVEYPLELDLKPFIISRRPDHDDEEGDEEEETKYDLYAVLVHVGNAHYGHYYCDVRSSPTTWHTMDDEKVYAISEDDALNEKGAYILFYIKKGSSPWFSALMEDKDEIMPHSSSSCSTSTRPLQPPKNTKRHAKVRVNFDMHEDDGYEDEDRGYEGLDYSRIYIPFRRSRWASRNQDHVIY